LNSHVAGNSRGGYVARHKTDDIRCKNGI
jgi:hypothetical protein